MGIPVTSVLCLLALALTVSAKGSFGSCPSISGVGDFELTKYLGTWYEIIRSKDIPFEKGNCVQTHYSVLPTGKVNVTNSEARNGELVYAYGQAYCDNTGYANCHVSFSAWSPDGGYQVLSTDYNQHAVVFSCFSIGVYHWSYGWLLSRTPTIDPTYETYMQMIPGLESSDFMHTAQDNCPPRNY